MTEQTPVITRWRLYLIIFLFLTLLAFMNFTRFSTNELAEGNPGKFRFYLIMETTGAYSLMLLLPMVVWFIKKFPIQKKNFVRRLFLHLFASMIYGVCHTLLMYFIRNFIYWLLDWGLYDYGQIKIRFIMEYTHQFFEYLAIYGVVFLLKTVRENQQQKIKAVQLEQEITRARLQALQVQLNPHFLFNTLNMISSAVYENARAADQMIANLSELLRITLNSRSAAEIPLEKELELLNLYLQIMKARFGKKLQIKIELEKGTHAALVPGFILQPLVENSIRHGIQNLGKTKIELLVRKENSKLVITLKDNGPGISAMTPELFKNGVGLSSTVERLEKMYASNQSLHLENLDSGGLKVVLQIPFRETSQEV